MSYDKADMKSSARTEYSSTYKGCFPIRPAFSAPLRPSGFRAKEASQSQFTATEDGVFSLASLATRHPCMQCKMKEKGVRSGWCKPAIGTILV